MGYGLFMVRYVFIGKKIKLKNIVVSTLKARKLSICVNVPILFPDALRFVSCIFFFYQKTSTIKLSTLKSWHGRNAYTCSKKIRLRKRYSRNLLNRAFKYALIWLCSFRFIFVLLLSSKTLPQQENFTFFSFYFHSYLAISFYIRALLYYKSCSLKFHSFSDIDFFLQFCIENTLIEIS